MRKLIYSTSNPARVDFMLDIGMQFISIISII